VDLMLRDKVAIVTGASKGIGMAVTESLADEGALVVAAARRVSSLQGLENVTPVAVDFADATAPAELVRRTLEKHGRADILVNNVGAARLRMKGFLDVTDDDFMWSLEINLFTMLRTSRAVLGTMLKQGSGAIVNVASVNFNLLPHGSIVDYGAAKAAVVNVTKAMALEFKAYGVRVNAVSPGPVGTDLWLGEGAIAERIAAAGGPGPVAASDLELVRIGEDATDRFALPEEVATLVTYLASPRAANVTGKNYVIDGGMQTAY
jgi:NAD(P)-dependent dehydrogenase (short-subunit alcohol dehydrogenase family)